MTAVVATLLSPVAGMIIDPRTVALLGSFGRVVEVVEADVIELDAACFPIVLLRCIKLSEGRVGSGGGTANGGIVECRICGLANSMGVRSPPSSLCGKLKSPAPPLGSGGIGSLGNALVLDAGVGAPVERRDERDVKVLSPGDDIDSS